MKFEEEYTSDSEKTKDENTSKKVLSDDAYAIAMELQKIGRILGQR